MTTTSERLILVAAAVLGLAIGVTWVAAMFAIKPPRRAQR